MSLHDYTPLEKTIDTTFRDQNLLTQALVHRSYLNENPTFPFDHNERLEFLGDAVLELTVTEHLFRTYPNPEGELTNWRAALVNAKMLAKLAKDIDIESFLFLSRGEAKDRNSKARDYILANAFEALIGALYLDGGYDTAKKFVEQFVLPQLPDILSNKLYLDPKSAFQEAAQEKMGVTPHYEVIEETGPDHNKQFVVVVMIGADRIATGEGSSKQEAQEHAARAGLEVQGW